MLILNTTLLTQLYNIWLATCETQLHHFTEKEAWTLKTKITPSLFIDAPIPRQESECVGMYIIVMGEDFRSVSTISQLYFGIVLTARYVLYHT